MATTSPMRQPRRSAASDRKVMIKDRIADSMFQQLLLRPDEYSVIASPNLNGDYLSDAAAAQVGGLRSEGDDQRPDCRFDVPTAAAASGRVLGHRLTQSQWRLPLRCGSRAGRRPPIGR